MFFCPCPSMLQELLTGEVALLDTLFSKAVHNLCLGGNAGMVGAWYPASVLAVKPCLAYEYVLYGVVEHVPHVQYSCHVGWWYYYGVWLSPVWLAAEQLMFQPVSIPFPLYFIWRVFSC